MRSTMKWFAMVVVFAIATAAWAQDEGTPEGPGGRDGDMSEHERPGGMTDDQKAQIKTIMDDAREQAKAAEGPEEKREIFKEAHEKIFNEVLTEEQQKHARHRRHRRRNGDGEDGEDEGDDNNRRRPPRRRNNDDGEDGEDGDDNGRKHPPRRRHGGGDGGEGDDEDGNNGRRRPPRRRGQGRGGDGGEGGSEE